MTFYLTEGQMEVNGSLITQPRLPPDKRVHVSTQIDSGVICRKTEADSEQSPELLLLYLSRSAVITPAAGQMSSAVLSQREIVGCNRKMVLSPSLSPESIFHLSLCYFLVSSISTSVPSSPFSIQWSYPKFPRLFLSSYRCGSSLAVAMLC